MSEATVRDQYERYPYPARDPRDEAKRLITGSPSNLLEVNHYLFRGRRDFSKPFRALFAGGGTGDGTIMLAQQLADTGCPAELHYLDLSESARETAEARAEARGLTNISFHSGSLLDLTALGLGTFDYIDCCGVLHHLEDPAAGLKALAAGLTDDGGMGIMVYGTYGRRGVYETQTMLRDLGADKPLDERIQIARRLLKALPVSNWLKRNPFVGDHHRSDAELVDLLLHSQDRAFTVPELIALVSETDLKPAAFIEPARYDPGTYLSDGLLKKQLSALDPLEQAAFAERLAGNLKRHILYLSKTGRDSVARLEGPEAIPCYREMEGEKLAAALRAKPFLKIEFDGLTLRVPMPRLAAPIAALIDGIRPVGAIQDAVMENDSTLDAETFATQFEAFYKALNGLNHLFLRFPA